MASGFYNSALYDTNRANIDLDGDTLKLGLTGTAAGGYTYNPDHVFLEEAANDVNEEELAGVSGYTGGFAGAGRKTVTITGQANNTNNRADFAIADLTWTALGTGDTIDTAFLCKEITNDAGSKLIASFDLTNTPTNGGDITLDFLALGSGGNLRFAA
jgi:hypothetical protein